MIQPFGYVGFDLTLDLRDNLQALVYFTGRYEPGLQRFLRSELREGDVAVDVGAHIGVHSLVMAERLRALGGGTVWAFEPAADTSERLRIAASRNGLDVHVVQFALGNDECVVALRARPEYHEADAGVRSQFGAGVVIQHVRQGGMRDALTRLRPRAVVVEMKPTPGSTHESIAEDTRAILGSAGYTTSGLIFERNEVFRPI